VRQEAPHGAVPQHPLLRAPRGHAAPLRRLRRERRRQQRRRRPAAGDGDEVLPDDPQERAARRREAPRELRQLRRGDHRQAAEVGVHDGARRLRVQPRQALGVVLPQAQVKRAAGGGGGLIVVVVPEAEKGAQRPDGVDARVLGTEGGEDVRLKGVERVDDERAGLGAVVGLGVVEPQAEIVGIGGADEAGDVAEADRRHAGDPVDHRRL